MNIKDLRNQAKNALQAGEPLEAKPESEVTRRPVDLSDL